MNRVPKIELCLKNTIMCTHSESIIKILTAGHIFSESAFIRTYAWNYDESAAESTGSMSAPSFPASPTTVTGEPGDSRLEGRVQRTFLPVLRRNIFPWGPWLAVVDLLSEHTCMRLCDPLGFCTVPLTLSILLGTLPMFQQWPLNSPSWKCEVTM